MVRREQFINEIGSLKYAYKGQQKRTYLYRKTGGTHYISVPMADLLEDEYVTSALRQAGEPPDSVKAFLASCKH